MDDSQTGFNQPYPYGFDIDLMKRSMDSAGGPDAKKARWSPPNSYPNNGASPRDAFANYGYGPQGGLNQAAFPGNSNNTSPLYSTPTALSINTNGSVPGLPSQLSPNTAAAFAQQQVQQVQAQQQAQAQAQQQANAANGNAAAYANFQYNMMGMGIPGMNMLGGFPYNPQMGNFGQNFNQQRLPSLNLQIPNTQSPYSPSMMNSATSLAAAANLSNAANNATGRTVYVGNLPSTASVDELLNLVHFGPLESIRVLPEKSCVFLSFLDGATAAAFHADATIKKLTLHNQELKIGWGKPSPVPPQVLLAITQSNASRNVYLGGLDESLTEEFLRDDLSRFGLIDQVKIVRDKNIGFVHFLSIATANKVVNTLPTEVRWAGKRVNYGKDRCAYVPKSQQAAAQQAQVAAAQSLVAQSPVGGFQQSPFSAYPGGGGLPVFSPADAAMQNMANAANAGAQGLNRTVYLGNIHPETTTEDLCNAIRGGVLQSIRYMQDKHIAFITFIDPAAAFTFYQVASFQGLTLNNRRLKIGWGKNSGPLPPTLALAVHSGATRNVYVGNIENAEIFNEDRLKRDFGEYGDIELVNFLSEKNCAFVNFTNISNAIKAIDGIKSKPDYTSLRIAHGKDRCANPPRSGPQSGGGAGNARRSNSGNTITSAHPGSAVEGSSALGEIDHDTMLLLAEQQLLDEQQQDNSDGGLIVTDIATGATAAGMVVDDEESKPNVGAK